MAVPEALRDFWNAFAQACGGADELAALVLRGRKRATASAWWTYQAEGKPLPRPGQLSIVTGSDGVPLCVIETLAVDVVPFDQVSADFAATEGEGDGSLAFWRKAHTLFFSRECAQAGQVFQPDMPVVCERFRLRYPPAGG